MEYLHNLLYVVIAGAFGGMLYAIKDKRVMIPSVRYSVQKDEINKKDIKKYESIELGIIADFLFGIGGGLLIFLITPAAPDPKENFGMIKLLSLAIAGGYSGQLLVRKISDNNLESISIKLNDETDKLSLINNDLPSKMGELSSIMGELSSITESLLKLERYRENDQKAYKMFYEIIDGSFFEAEEIRKVLQHASQSVKLRGFTLLDDRRKELVLKILENKEAPVQKISSIKKEFEQLIPLLEELIKSEESCNKNDFQLAYHYASLAYMYKYINIPSWRNALIFTNKAIDIHAKKHKDVDTPEIYILNKLICHINLGEQDESNSSFRRLWELPMGKHELIRLDPVLAPNFHAWISRYYPEEIKNLFLINKNYWQYKKNWLELFPEDKEFRGC